MEPFLNLVEDSDGCSAIVSILLLTIIGQKMVDSRPHLHPWGWRAAAAAFLAYGVYGLAKEEGITADQLLVVIVRGLVAAGFVLGPAWMALAVVGFSYEITIKPAIDAADEIAQQQRQRREEGERQRQREEAERLRAREREDAERRQRECPPPPPPPTRDERAAAARERYKHQLHLLEGAGLDALELEAGRDEAKQRYLRELNGALQ